MGLILCGYITGFSRTIFEVSRETYDDVVAKTFENSTLFGSFQFGLNVWNRQTVIANSVGVIAAQLPD